MGGRWWTKKTKNKENMIGKRGTKLIVFFCYLGGGSSHFFNIKIVLPPQRDQINRGRFFNPVSTLPKTPWLGKFGTTKKTSGPRLKGSLKQSRYGRRRANGAWTPRQCRQVALLR